MIEILKNKNLATKFQILVEIADKGPFIQQRQIAKALGITPQAVSDYISRLSSESMLISEGRSCYRLTGEAVNWVIKVLREMDDYNNSIQKAINNIATCAAIAEDDIKKGAEVGLKMESGLLYATSMAGKGATGKAASSARQGEDIGITAIKGIVELTVGSVVILKIPDVEKGGSRHTNYQKLNKFTASCMPVLALGLEAYIACIKWGGKFQYFGSAEAAIEAAKSGLNPLAVCAEGETSSLIKRLADAGINYQIFDGETP
jgi:putative transcriptional regulator